jgi:hypothetical protein
MPRIITRLIRRFRPRPQVVFTPPLSTIDPRKMDPATRRMVDDWLEDPTTKLVLGLVEAKHPGLHTSRVTRHAKSEWDQLAAVNLLNYIAGFEAYRNAIIALANIPRPSGDIPETYPSE